MLSLPADILPAIVQNPRAAEALRCCSRELLALVKPFGGGSLVLTNGWWTATLDECEFCVYEEFRDGYYQISEFCETVFRNRPVKYKAVYLLPFESELPYNIGVFTGDRVECTRWGMVEYKYECCWGARDDCIAVIDHSLFNTPGAPFDYLLHGGRSFIHANGGYNALPCNSEYLERATRTLNGFLVFQYKRA